jgi:hypothetical protein
MNLGTRGTDAENIMNYIIFFYGGYQMLWYLFRKLNKNIKDG